MSSPPDLHARSRGRSAPGLLVASLPVASLRVASLSVASFLAVLLSATPPRAPPASTAPASNTAPTATSPAPSISVERVRALVAEARADTPARGTERHLRWIKDDSVARPPTAAPPEWLFGLVKWLAEGARWMMWLLGAVGVALVAVFAWRWIRIQADAVRARASLRPTHVNELDIRPESLPDDIAGAARALLERGRPREALSLLYRGALSNLVHVHGVEVRGASTEGECLQLARRHLPQADADFFARLVQAWQTEVYADRRQAPEALADLCAQFDAHVGRVPPRGRTAGAAA